MKNEKAALLLVAVLTLSAATVVSVPSRHASMRQLTQRELTERAMGLLSYLGVNDAECKSRLLAISKSGKILTRRAHDNRICPLDCAPGAEALRLSRAPRCFAAAGREKRAAMTAQRRFDIRRTLSPPRAAAC